MTDFVLLYVVTAYQIYTLISSPKTRYQLGNFNYNPKGLQKIDMILSRLNYILWVQALIDTTYDDYRDDYNRNRDVVGLDMYFNPHL
jgi:hypothetical protein